MSKITKTNLNNLKEFLRASNFGKNCVKVSDWTTGSGRYIKTKTLPIFTKQFNRSDFKYVTNEYGFTYPTALNGQGLSYDTIERQAGDFFAANPRVQKCIVLDQNAMIDALHGVELK